VAAMTAPPPFPRALRCVTSLHCTMCKIPWVASKAVTPRAPVGSHSARLQCTREEIVPQLV